MRPTLAIEYELLSGTIGAKKGRSNLKVLLLPLLADAAKCRPESVILTLSASTLSVAGASNL